MRTKKKHANAQAIAMCLSDGRLIVVQCLEEDDWEATIESVAVAQEHQNGADCGADDFVFPVTCLTLPDSVDLQGPRCALTPSESVVVMLAPQLGTLVPDLHLSEIAGHGQAHGLDI